MDTKNNIAVVRRNINCGCIVLLQRAADGHCKQVERNVRNCTAERRHGPWEKAQLSWGRENAETARTHTRRNNFDGQSLYERVAMQAAWAFCERSAGQEQSNNPFAVMLAGVKVASDGSLRRGGRFVRL